MSTPQEIMDVVKTSGDCVVARQAEGTNVLDVSFVAGENDIGEFLGSVSDGETIYLGAFPARDDDGENAVSWIVHD